VYRGVRIIRTALQHVVPHGLSAAVQVQLAGGAGVSAAVNATARVRNDAAAAGVLTARFTLVDDATGAAVASTDGAGAGASAEVPAGATAELRAPIALRNPRLWSVQTPATYTLSVTISQAPATGGGGGGERVVDHKNSTVGFREAAFDANTGFRLNGQRLILRGFSNHNSFAGVGVAVPASATPGPCGIGI